MCNYIPGVKRQGKLNSLYIYKLRTLLFFGFVHPPQNKASIIIVNFLFLFQQRFKSLENKLIASAVLHAFIYSKINKEMPTNGECDPEMFII
jgi:hypothetical protein